MKRLNNKKNMSHFDHFLVNGDMLAAPDCSKPVYGVDLYKVRNQLEFYFSQVNLTKDHWLASRMDPETGNIPISTFLTFNRIKDLGVENVGQLIAACETSELIGVDKGTFFYRKVPFDLEYDPEPLTVVIEPWSPTDDIDFTKAWVEEKVGAGSVAAVWRRRRRYDRSILPSVYVVMKNAEAVKKIISDGEWQAPFDESATVNVMKKSDWINKKREARKKTDAETVVTH